MKINDRVLEGDWILWRIVWRVMANTGPECIAGG